MALQQVLLNGQPMATGQEIRLLPGLDVSAFDRLHLHISGGASSIASVSVQVLFGSPAGNLTLLADSAVWFEDTVWERAFSHTTPSNYSGTGFVMSVPVVAPTLYDVILRNEGASKPTIYVALLAQDI